MNIKNFRRQLFPPLLGLVLVGCQTHTAVRPLPNGYEEVWHPHHTLIDEPAPPRISFQHRAADGTVTPIWPSLYGSQEVFHGDVAYFVAERGDPAEHVTRPRLFSVKPGELPLDLTDEILWRWARANGKDFGQTLAWFASVVPVEKNGGLAVQLDFIPDSPLLHPDRDWPDRSELWLDWDQVAALNVAVKKKGMELKDPRWRKSFIGENY